MSSNQDPLAAAKQAERDLNSYQAKQGLNNNSDSIETRFPGASVTYGSAASGAGDNREIPVEEGGSIGRDGQPSKARDFEGVGGPEDKERLAREVRGDDDEVVGNVRQGGITGDGAVRG
ncbi:hypothetical protein N431DRAFT_452252 [Stipitochalara longipes BDJ]|nr:hypothetical protein N431DRAFT_452252 [Stipitochalara longipes BDJ]